MENSKKNVRYQRGYVERLNKDKEGDARGSLELWVHSCSGVETAANGKKVIQLNCNGKFAKSSGIPYALGDVQNEDGVIFVRVTVWEPLTNYVEKLNLDKGSRIQVYGRFTVNEFTRADNTVGKSVECTAKKVELKWPLADGHGESFGGYLDREVVDVAGKGVGSLAMYLTEPVTVRKTTNANEVGDVKLSGRFQNNSGVPYALGDDILDPKDGHMFVNGAAWGYALDSFKKLNLQKGALIQIYGHFEVREFTRSDGTTGKAVECKDIRKFEVLSFGQPKAENASAAPADSAAPAADVEDADDNFQPPASFGDIVVPF